MADAIREAARARAPGNATAGAYGEVGAWGAAGRAENTITAETRAALEGREGGRSGVACQRVNWTRGGVVCVKVEEGRGVGGGWDAVCKGGGRGAADGGDGKRALGEWRDNSRTPASDRSHEKLEGGVGIACRRKGARDRVGALADGEVDGRRVCFGGEVQCYF